VSALYAWSGERRYDLSIECVGLTETMQVAIDAVRPEGLALLAGITEAEGSIDLSRVVEGEIEVRGCIGYFDGEFEAVIDLMASGRLDPGPLVTSTIGVDEVVEQGFERLVAERGEHVKILVTP
jgi:(R,R)-butanediol dehydrogenase/meso-butanediol dehydrogenase/diacetyl reductase